MNIVLDWLVDNHKAANARAWKESSLTISESALVFQSCGVKAKIYQSCFGYIVANITKYDRNVESFDVWSVVKWYYPTVMFRLNCFNGPNIEFIRESMFKTKLILSGKETVHEFLIHRDQFAEISNFVDRFKS